jgi:hypothetical protein
MERFYKKGLITTLIGLSILIFTGAMIFSGKSSAGEMAGWLTTALLFIRSKDSLIGLEPK